MGCGSSKQEQKPVEAAAAPAATQSSSVAKDDPSRKPSGPEVPPKKLFAIKDAFNSIDTNRTGAIDSAELDALLQKVGAELSDQEKRELMTSMDKDKTGKISYAEFVDWVLHNDGANDAVANYAVTKGLSDLHQAAVKGDADKIKELLAAGHKVNAGDIDAVTPLHYACRAGKPDAAQALIEAKADVLLQTSDTGRMPLHAAAENGKTQLVQLLLAAKSNVNATDGRQRTPLHWACACSREEAAIILMDAGSDLNVKSAAGYTPYAMAQDWSSASLANLIEARGGKRWAD